MCTEVWVLLLSFCFSQIPVACKSCPCGYVFISRKLLNAKLNERSPVMGKQCIFFMCMHLKPHVFIIPLLCYAKLCTVILFIKWPLIRCNVTVHLESDCWCIQWNVIPDINQLTFLSHWKMNTCSFHCFNIYPYESATVRLCLHSSGYTRESCWLFFLIYIHTIVMCWTLWASECK